MRLKLVEDINNNDWFSRFDPNAIKHEDWFAQWSISQDKDYKWSDRDEYDHPLENPYLAACDLLNVYPVGSTQLGQGVIEYRDNDNDQVQYTVDAQYLEEFIDDITRELQSHAGKLQLLNWATVKIAEFISKGKTNDLNEDVKKDDDEEDYAQLEAQYQDLMDSLKDVPRYDFSKITKKELDEWE